MANTKRSLKILHIHARTKYIHTLTQSEIQSKREHEWRWTITKEEKNHINMTKRNEKRKRKPKLKRHQTHKSVFRCFRIWWVRGSKLISYAIYFQLIHIWLAVCSYSKDMGTFCPLIFNEIFVDNSAHTVTFKRRIKSAICAYEENAVYTLYNIYTINVFQCSQQSCMSK